MAISDVQLREISGALSVLFTDGDPPDNESCFDAAYEACTRGEWERLDPIRDSLALLANKDGYTLFTKAVCTRKISVANGLMDRKLAVGPSNSLGEEVVTNLFKSFIFFVGQSFFVFREEERAEEYVAVLDECVQKWQVVRPDLCVYVLSNLASIYSQAGKWDRSILYRERACKLHEPDLEKETDWGQIHDSFAKRRLELAVSYGEAGRFDEAYELAKLVKAEFDKNMTDEKRSLYVRVLYDLGLHASKAGKFAEAEGHFVASKNLSEQLDGPWNQLAFKAYHKIGVLELRRGALQEAETTLRQVFGACSFLSQDDPSSSLTICDVARDLGSVYREKGEFQKTMELQSLAYEWHKRLRGDDHKETAKALRSLAITYGELGKLGEAIDLLEENLRLREKVMDEDERMTILANLGALYTDSRDKDRLLIAKGYYLRALEIAKKEGDESALVKLIGNLGRTLLELGEQDKATEHFQALATRLQSSSSDQDRLLGLSQIGHFHLRIGNFEKGRQAFSLVVDILKGTESYELGYAYMSLGNALGAVARYDDAEQAYARAIEIFSKTQADLPEDEWKISIFEQQAGARMAAELTSHIQNKPDQALTTSDDRKARSLKSILDRQISEEVSPPLTVAEVQRVAAQQNATLITFSCARNVAGLIDIHVIKHTGEIPHHSIPTTEVEGQNKTPFAAFPFFSKAGELPTFEKADILSKMEEASKGPLTQAQLQLRDKLREEFKEQLRVWYTEFIEPIQAMLPEDGGKITFITDGFLSKVPFHLLLGPDGHLFEKYVISCVPSIAVLDLLSKREQAKGISPGTLIVDDPINEVGELKTGGEESAKLAGLMGAKPEEVLQREKATVTQVLSQMQKAGHIHVSCHALDTLRKSPHSVYEGGLYLTEDAEHPGGGLFAEEIAKANMRTSLVFLSACSTGLGNRLKDGVIGLVRSFLAAGSSSVIASLWRVSDSDLTVQMVEHFYERLKKDGLSKAEALRNAMLFGMSLDPAAIERWGVFSLTGLP